MMKIVEINEGYTYGNKAGAICKVIEILTLGKKSENSEVVYFPIHLHRMAWDLKLRKAKKEELKGKLLRVSLESFARFVEFRVI